MVLVFSGIEYFLFGKGFVLVVGVRREVIVMDKGGFLFFDGKVFSLELNSFYLVVSLVWK